MSPAREAVVMFGGWAVIMVIVTRWLVAHLKETDGDDWRKS